MAKRAVAPNLSQIHAWDTEQLEAAATHWAARGVDSAITWDYALMLAQIRGVKADRMVIKYVTRCRAPDIGGLDQVAAGS
jgi:hypothetical protein